MPKFLTNAQVKDYVHNGLLFPLAVLSPEEAAAFRAASDDLEAQMGGNPRTIDVRQMHLHFEWAHALATNQRVLDIVEDILGPDILIWATELFTKHPFDQSIAISWHRDRDYMGFATNCTVSAWISLGHSNPENGCMQALPGPDRHKDEWFCHPSKESPSMERYAGVLTDVILRPGEMSLHDSEVPHGSQENRSSDKRVGFVVRYVTPNARPLHGRPRVSLARGKCDVDHFELVEPSFGLRPDEAICGMQESASEHFESILHNLMKMRGTPPRPTPTEMPPSR